MCIMCSFTDGRCFRLSLCLLFPLSVTTGELATSPLTRTHATRATVECNPKDIPIHYNHRRDTPVSDVRQHRIIELSAAISASPVVLRRPSLIGQSGGGQDNPAGRGCWRGRRRSRPYRAPPRARPSRGDSFPDQDFQRRPQIPSVLQRSAAATSGGGRGGTAAQHQRDPGVCGRRRNILAPRVLH